MLRVLSLSIALLYLISCEQMQNISNPPIDNPEVEAVIDEYHSFKETAIKDQRFKHALIDSLAKKYATADAISLKHEGNSYEGRSINRLSIGTGDTQVLMWTQMHGNEPTATMAVFDLLKFLSAQNDTYEALRTQILASSTIHIIPMLNPDGAERFQRRTAQGIDMNRDALQLQTPEGRILKRVRDELDADFAFNLHDQSRYYRVGDTDKAATISFLAPAYNVEKAVNAKRSRAKKLIGVMNQRMQKMAEGHVGRYDDTFEPRAFGDNIAKWGSSTILIESGGYPNDPEKQFIRKLNFAALLTALESIASESYEFASIADYYKIPENDRDYLQLKLENVSIVDEDKSYIIDMGFQHREINWNGATSYYLRASIEDLGDLSTSTSYQNMDASGLRLRLGLNYPERKKLEEWSIQNITEALKQGYAYFPIHDEKNLSPFSSLPGIFYVKDMPPRYGLPTPGNNPAFFLMNEKEEILYAVINGFLIDLKNVSFDGNGLILR